MTDSFTTTSEYRVPRHPASVSLHLDGNEGQLLTPTLMAALNDFDASRLRRYPSTKDLEAKIAAEFGVASSQVLVTAGADDGLLRM